MKKYDVVDIALKLGGLYLVINSMTYISVILMAFGGGNGASIFTTAVLPMLAFVVCGFFLIFKSGMLAGFFYPNTGGVLTLGIDKSTLLQVLIIAIGISEIAHAIYPVINAIIFSMQTSGRIFSEEVMNKNLIKAFIEIAIGVVLIAGSKKIVSIVLK